MQAVYINNLRANRGDRRVHVDAGHDQLPLGARGRDAGRRSTPEIGKLRYIIEDDEFSRLGSDRRALQDQGTLSLEESVVLRFGDELGGAFGCSHEHTRELMPFRVAIRRATPKAATDGSMGSTPSASSRSRSSPRLWSRTSPASSRARRAAASTSRAATAARCGKSWTDANKRVEERYADAWVRRGTRRDDSGGRRAARRVRRPGGRLPRGGAAVRAAARTGVSALVDMASRCGAACTRPSKDS